jgi:hypothetical protein
VDEEVAELELEHKEQHEPEQFMTRCALRHQRTKKRGRGRGRGGRGRGSARARARARARATEHLLKARELAGARRHLGDTVVVHVKHAKVGEGSEGGRDHGEEIRRHVALDQGYLRGQ